MVLRGRQQPATRTVFLRGTFRVPQSAKISTATLVIKEGDAEWKPYREIFRASSPQVPLPPVPSAHVTPSQTQPATPERGESTKPKRFWPTFLALFFLYPIGLFMLWRNKEVSKRMKIILSVLCGVLFLTIGESGNDAPSVSSSSPASVSKSTPEPTPKRTQSDALPYIVAGKSDMPLEQQLALVNAKKGALPSDDVTIARFRYLLERAAEQTGDTQKEIADTACKGQGLVLENGKSVTLLNFMEGVNKFLSTPGLPKTKYQEAALIMSAELSK